MLKTAFSWLIGTIMISISPYVNYYYSILAIEMYKKINQEESDNLNTAFLMSRINEEFHIWITTKFAQPVNIHSRLDCFYWD